MFVFRVRLLSHHIYVMEILLILIFLRNHSWSRNSRFSDLMLENSPIILLLLEISHPLFRQSIRDSNVNPSWRQHFVNFLQHLISIWPRSIPTEDGIESSLINYSVKGALFILETTDIHLFEGEVWTFFFVHFLHLFDYGEWNIDVGDVLVPIFIHFLTQS